MKLRTLIAGVFALFLASCVPPVEPGSPINPPVDNEPQPSVISGKSVVFEKTGLLDRAEVTKVEVWVFNSTQDVVATASLRVQEKDVGPVWSGELSALPTGEVTLIFSAQNTGGVQLYYGSKVLTWTTSSQIEITAHGSTAALTYTAVDGGYSVTKAAGLGGGTVVVPAYWLGRPVIALGYAAFSGQVDPVTFSSIELPDTLVRIEDEAFAFADQLTALVIPDSVTSLGGLFAYGCTALTSVTLPAGLTDLPSGAFAASGLTTLTLPPGLVTIGANAFQDSPLTSLTFPASVTDIGPGAFMNSALTGTINLPPNLTTIRSELLSGCSGVTAVTLPTTLTGLEAYAFYHTGITAMTLPSWMNEVPQGLFQGCTSLTSVTFQGPLDAIFSEAFSECTALETVTITGQVTPMSLHNNAFFHCESLTSFNYPLAHVANDAFHGASSLSSVSLGSSLETIGEWAFAGTALTSLDLSGTQVATVSDSAFSECTQLTSATFPTSLTNLGSWALTGCSQLVTVTFLGDTPPAFGSEPLSAVVAGNAAGPLTNLLHIYVNASDLDEVLLNYRSGLLNKGGGYDAAFTNRVSVAP